MTYIPYEEIIELLEHLLYHTHSVHMYMCEGNIYYVLVIPRLCWNHNANILSIVLTGYIIFVIPRLCWVHGDILECQEAIYRGPPVKTIESMLAL